MSSNDIRFRSQKMLIQFPTEKNKELSKRKNQAPSSQLKKAASINEKPDKLLIPSNAARSGPHRRTSTLPAHVAPVPGQRFYRMPVIVRVCVSAGNKNICSLFAVANKFIIKLRTSSAFDGSKLATRNELARSPSNGITDALYLSVCLLCNACLMASVWRL